MSKQDKVSSSRIHDLFAGWSSFCYRYGAGVLIVSLLTAIGCGFYVSRNLGMNTDTTDMLSEDLPFRINMKRYKETFPQDVDTLLIVLAAFIRVNDPIEGHCGRTRRDHGDDDPEEFRDENAGA